jgi:hypothetical protein
MQARAPAPWVAHVYLVTQTLFTCDRTAEALRTADERAAASAAEQVRAAHERATQAETRYTWVCSSKSRQCKSACHSRIASYETLYTLQAGLLVF